MSPKVTPWNGADLTASEVGHSPLDLSSPGFFRIWISLVVKALEKTTSQLGALVLTEPGSLSIQLFDHADHGSYSTGIERGLLASDGERSDAGGVSGVRPVEY